MESWQVKSLLLFLGLAITLEVIEGATRYDATDRVSIVKSTTAGKNQGGTARTYNIASLLQMDRSERLVSVDMVKTAQGRYKRRLRETYAGYEVIGFGVEAEYDIRTGYTGVVSGDIIIGIKKDVAQSPCIQTKKTVLEIALMNSGLADGNPDVTDEHIKRKIFLKDNGNATFVYQVDFLYLSGNKVSRPFYIIDACDLSVLENFDRVNNETSSLRRFLQSLNQPVHCEDPTTERPTTPEPTTSEPPVTVENCEDNTTPSPTECASPAKGVGGNAKTGKYEYGVAPRCINPKVEGTMCTLETEHVKVIDLNQSIDRRKKTPANFSCSDGYSDAVNEAYSPVMDAFYFGYTTVQAIRQWYKLDPLGFKPVMYVHYGKGYENAFWDGKSLTFGDGRNFFYPLVSLDVVAHELGHGITTRFSDLHYSKQSGGINEAFSDITGELVEAFAASNDWNVGFELRKSPTKSLRYFKDPTRDGRSIKHVKNYKSGLDVHYSSGLFNHAFYQLVEVEKMPMREAYHCFIQANRIYWKQRSTFEQGACGVLQSAHDLGLNSYLSKIKASFAVVGIEMADCKESSFMEVLKNGDTIRYLTVSPDKNPMYLLDHPLFATSVTIKAKNSGRGLIGIELTTDIDGQVVAYNETSLTYNIENTSSMFVILSSETFNNRVTLEITFSLPPLPSTSLIPQSFL